MPIGSISNGEAGSDVRTKLNAVITAVNGLGTASAAALDTDGTMAANSDARVPSQKAVVTYVASLVAGLLDFKGSTDASANPNYPAASKGDAYVISVAGKIGGASGKTVAAGDFVVAIADNAGGTEASVGTSWIVLESNITGITAAGLAMIQAMSAAAQTALLSAVVGDSGSGGTKGLVPAPAAGDAAAGKYLKADGTFAVPPNGAVALANLAFVCATNGSDVTGAIGNITKPYATMSAAYDAGARSFMLGAGTHAGLSKSGAVNVNVLGIGKSQTTITIIESTNAGDLTIRDLGVHTCTITTISRIGLQGAVGQGGTQSSNIVLENVLCTTIQNTGGQGGDSDGTNNAAGGGSSGAITMVGRCQIGTVNNNGGQGGSYVNANENGGVGGSAGNVTISEGCVIENFYAGGGVGGNGDPGSGTGGSGGNGASQFQIRGSRITSTLNISAGSGGSGAGGGSAGECGNLDARHADIGALSMDDGSNAGDIAGEFIKIGTLSGSPTISALISHINGSTY